MSKNRRWVVGVMGAEEPADEASLAMALALGREISSNQWVLLTGGRDAGVMAAATRGAASVEGHMIVGVLPSEGGATVEGLDLAIYTGMGQVSMKCFTWSWSG